MSTLQCSVSVFSLSACQTTRPSLPYRMGGGGGRIFSKVFYLTTLSVSRLCRVHGRLFNEYGAVGGISIDKGKQSTRRKPAPVAIGPPQIPRD
jgi:hypothetical protein